MKTASKLGKNGQRLLALLVNEMKKYRFVSFRPETFMSYEEALDKLGITRRSRAEQQLQREGLTELNDWTKANPQLPKIAGLIVNKKTHRPSPAFAKSHEVECADWEIWWLMEVERAIAFEDWQQYLDVPSISYQESTAKPMTVEEPESAVDYRRIITLEPGKRGGKPCIRGLRITVSDILGWLASGMSHGDIRKDFPEVTEADIRACLNYAANKEQGEKATFTRKWTGRFKMPQRDKSDPRLSYLLDRYEGIKK